MDETGEDGGVMVELVGMAEVVVEDGAMVPADLVVREVAAAGAVVLVEEVQDDDVYL